MREGIYKEGGWGRGWDGEGMARGGEGAGEEEGEEENMHALLRLTNGGARMTCSIPLGIRLRLRLYDSLPRASQHGERGELRLWGSTQSLDGSST